MSEDSDDADDTSRQETKSSLSRVWNKFRSTGNRFSLSYIGYHHILMILLGIYVVIVSLQLAGCASTWQYGHSIYIISLANHLDEDAMSSPPWRNITALISSASQSTQLQVRVGYFGICASHSGPWICHENTTLLARLFDDPLGLIAMASRYRREVLFPGLLIANIAFSVISFIGLSTFPGWRMEGGDDDDDSERDVKPFPSRPVSQAVCGLTCLASLFGLVSALWQHTSAASAASLIRFTMYGHVKARVGGLAAALAWLGFLFQTLVAGGLGIIIYSVRRLDRMIDD